MTLYEYRTNTGPKQSTSAALGMLRTAYPMHSQLVHTEQMRLAVALSGSLSLASDSTNGVVYK